MIRGAGMPSYRHHNPGNLFIRFDIDFPSTTPPLSEEQRALLKGALGLPPTQPRVKAPYNANGMDVDQEPLELDPQTLPVPAGAMEEEVDLEEVDQQGANRATMDDDDEDGVPHGAERMQCASQ